MRVVDTEMFFNSWKFAEPLNFRTLSMNFSRIHRPKGDVGIEPATYREPFSEILS
jgi:hypothetical protein